MFILTTHKKTQQGVALFVSLIFLLILTLLGISAMQSTIMEEKMAGNFNDQNRALQAAETSLRVAENWLQGLTLRPVTAFPPGSTQVWNIMGAEADPSAGGVNCDDNNTMWWRQCDVLWWTANAVQVIPTLSDVNTLPFYVIEEQAFVRDSLTMGQEEPKGRNVYRVTGRGTGGNDLTRVLIQSSYARRF